MIIYKRCLTKVVATVTGAGDPLKLRTDRLENIDGDILKITKDIFVDWSYLIYGVDKLKTLKPGRKYIHLWISGHWPGWKEFRT